jgi:hypothetical protein
MAAIHLLTILGSEYYLAGGSLESIPDRQSQSTFTKIARQDHVYSLFIQCSQAGKQVSCDLCQIISGPE